MKCNILSIKQTLAMVVALVFALPQFANAAWYWVPVPTAPQTGYFIEEVSPNTIGYTAPDSVSYEGRTITPEGFMDVMDYTKDSSKCSGELDSAISQLRNFDSSKVVQPTGRCYGECGPYFAQGAETERASLLSKLKSSAEQCLVNEEQAIQKAEEERQRKEAEAKRLKEVEQAGANCDFDFFSNEMTDKERMDTWEERQACKAKDTTEAVSELVVESVTPVIQPAQPTQPTQPSQPTLPVSQTPIVTPSYTQPVTKADNSNIESEQKEETAATSTVSSETVEQTMPEIQETEVTTAQEPEKVTFFQKIIRFFTGWFR